MTEGQLTVAEWTRWNLDKLMIYRSRRATFEEGFNEANRLVSCLFDLKKAYGLHNEEMRLAIEGLTANREVLRGRIMEAHDYEMAY